MPYENKVPYAVIYDILETSDTLKEAKKRVEKIAKTAGISLNSSEMEMRHQERGLLFKLLKAKKLNKIEDVISELITRMEKDDVEVVKQQMTEWEQNNG